MPKVLHGLCITDTGEKKCLEPTRRTGFESGGLADRQGKPIRRKGGETLARVREQGVLTAEDVERAICGHLLGTLRLDKERLVSLRLLSERHGLWGAGRQRLAPSPGAPRPEPETFRIVDPPPKAN